MIAALRFSVNDEYNADIYPAGSFDRIDWDHSESCSLGNDFSVFSFKGEKNKTDLIRVETGLDGNDILRLTETKRYIIRINSNLEQPVSLPRIQNEGNNSLKLDKDKNTVTFQFVNYLGRSRITFQNRNGNRVLLFEVVPDKMDFENDYVVLTEAIAERCAELLLDYAGSTSNVFSLGERNSRTVLEQFIFLRQFCFSENIQSLFEEIRRNPDRALVEDEEFHPLGSGMPSKKVYTKPFKYGRNWNGYTSSAGRKYYLPSEVVVSYKKDNLDTPANRFLKFALEQFDEVCETLMDSLNQNGESRQMECMREAKIIHRMLDDILRDSFFDEVGPLSVMPQNNQVLQKREGYSQIFSAYAMLDLALQLDWKGKNNIYEGESKNVALLYEYWLFFELCRVVAGIDGCEIEEADENPFIAQDNNRLIISLQEGQKSCQAFAIRKLGIKINLYYNRSFYPAEFRTTEYEGSYSRKFRPDYTLAIFPDRYTKGKYNGENAAMIDGQVSYIHFDAKYRITDLTSFIGSERENDENLQIEEEKTEEILNTYRRGDLLKMHTYNNAIRRTIGSYILYPGDGGKRNNWRRYVFSLYDEILPGVGAFAIKPSISSLGEEELNKFISALISEKAQNSSRLNRLEYYTEMILRDPPSTGTVTKQFIERNQKEMVHADDLCVIGYMRADKENDYYSFLKKSGKLRNGSEFWFYYYAIRNGTVYSHHPDIAKAGLFRMYTNRISDTDSYELEPVLCRIETNELTSKADLVRRLNELGYMTDEASHHADYYYVMKVRVINDSVAVVSLKSAEVNSVNSNDSFSPHSPKLLNITCIWHYQNQYFSGD